MARKSKSIVPSQSRNIQRAHRRRYSSGKVATINPNNKKQKSSVRSRTKSESVYRRRLRPLNIVPAQNKQVLKKNKIIELKPRTKQERLKLYDYLIDKDVWWKYASSLPDVNWIINSANQNFDEWQEMVWEDWVDFLGNPDTPAIDSFQDLDKGIKQFIREKSDYWEDSWGHKDNIRVSLHGDFNKIRDDDKTLYDVLLDEDTEDTWTYYHDPFDGKIISSNFNENSLDVNIRFSPKHWSPLIDMHDIILHEDLEKDGDLGNTFYGKLFQELKKEKIPMVMITAQYDSAIAVQKKFKEKAESIKKGLEARLEPKKR